MHEKFIYFSIKSIIFNILIFVNISIIVIRYRNLYVTLTYDSHRYN